MKHPYWYQMRLSVGKASVNMMTGQNTMDAVFERLREFVGPDGIKPGEVLTVWPIEEPVSKPKLSVVK